MDCIVLQSIYVGYMWAIAISFCKFIQLTSNTEMSVEQLMIFLPPEGETKIANS